MITNTRTHIAGHTRRCVGILATKNHHHRASARDYVREILAESLLFTTLIDSLSLAAFTFPLQIWRSGEEMATAANIMLQNV